MRAVALSIVLVLVSVGAARAQVGSVSPGKLARPHARFEQQCDRCHVGGGVPAKACLACHTRLADRLAKDVGFHTTVSAKPCTECHGDHKGRDFALSPQPPSTFDHRATVFPLDGKHANLACARCHTKAQWVGIPTACSRCHKDTAHHGELGSGCASCHRAERWKPATRTAADHTISLGGGHAKLTCAGCHRGGSHLAAQQACSHCHNQPHGGTRATCETCHAVASWKQVTYTHRTPAAKIEGSHQTLACLSCHPSFKFTKTPASCTGCHDKQRPHPALGSCELCHSASTWRTTNFDHQQPQVGFALDGAHTNLDCARCHTSPIKWGQPRRDCTGCHQNVHGTQFGAKPCTSCHTTQLWKPSLIAASQHDSFGFVLRDSHLKTQCSTCHKSGGFVGTASACAQCHIDRRHKGRFGTSCERCHDATVWKHTPAFDHTVTGFALERGHAKVACAKCHGANGQALVGRPAPTECTTCHATPHDRFFATKCVQCHSTASWRAVPKFDHDRTAFPLVMRHSTLRCTACHDAKRKPAIQRTCRSCHGDPHRGSNSWECEDCHRPDRWRIIRFDHDLTDYPLTGRHRVTACGRCHTNPNWMGVRTDCLGCHAFDRPNDQVHASEVICEDCHVTTRWRTIVKQ